MYCFHSVGDPEVGQALGQVIQRLEDVIKDSSSFSFSVSSKFTFPLRLISVVVIKWWQQSQINNAQTKKESFLDPFYLFIFKEVKKAFSATFQGSLLMLWERLGHMLISKSITEKKRLQQWVQTNGTQPWVHVGS